MSVFLIVLLLFVVMLFILYFPVITQQFVLKRAESKFSEELRLLNNFFMGRQIIITRRLGEGSSQNSDIKFAAAHENQSFAVNSVLVLVDELEG